MADERVSEIVAMAEIAHERVLTKAKERMKRELEAINTFIGGMN